MRSYRYSERAWHFAFAVRIFSRCQLLYPSLLLLLLLCSTCRIYALANETHKAASYYQSKKQK